MAKNIEGLIEKGKMIDGVYAKFSIAVDKAIRKEQKEMIRNLREISKEKGKK
jgi:hypothetical protein